MFRITNVSHNHCWHLKMRLVYWKVSYVWVCGCDLITLWWALNLRLSKCKRYTTVDWTDYGRRTSPSQLISIIPRVHSAQNPKEAMQEIERWDGIITILGLFVFSFLISWGSKLLALRRCPLLNERSTHFRGRNLSLLDDFVHVPLHCPSGSTS